MKMKTQVEGKTVLTHQILTHVVQPTVICLGIAFIVALIGLVILAVVREDKDRSIIPWSSRMRVERAKAHTEVLNEHMKQEAVEIKRLGLDLHRTKVLEAIEKGDLDVVRNLTLTGKPEIESSRY